MKKPVAEWTEKGGGEERERTERERRKGGRV